MIDTGISQLYTQGLLMRAGEINDGLRYLSRVAAHQNLFFQNKLFFTAFTYTLFSSHPRTRILPLTAAGCGEPSSLYDAKRYPEFYWLCLVGDDCCHLILTSISVTAQSDNIHGEEEGSLSPAYLDWTTLRYKPRVWGHHIRQQTSVYFLLISCHVTHTHKN